MKNRIALAALLGAAAIHPVHADNIRRRPMARSQDCRCLVHWSKSS